MVTCNLKKMSAVLLVAILHIPAYGITDVQAAIGSLFAGLASACIVKNSDDPRVITSAFLGIAGVSYYFARKHTPQVQLPSAKTIFDNLTNNILANSYNELALVMEQEMK